MITDRSSKASSYSACTRRRFVSFSAMLGLAPLAAAVAPGGAVALQDDAEGIVDPLGVLYTSLLRFSPYDAKMNEGVRVAFDPAVVGERGLVTAEALPQLPGSFQGVLAVQALATLPDDPAVFTANLIVKLFIFGDDGDARDWANVLNNPWLTGSATVYGEEQAGVQGHTLASYETPDVYQPNLTNTTWHGVFRHGGFVWQQTHSSVLPKLATGTGLEPVVDLAAAAKRELRNTVTSPLAGALLIPSDSRELLFVAARAGGNVISVFGDSDEALERRFILTDGATRAGSIQYGAIAADGGQIVVNQNVLEFGDDAEASNAWALWRSRFDTLDDMSGSERLFLEEPVDEALLGGAAQGVLDVFSFDPGGGLFGGTELVRQMDNRVLTRAVVTPAPLENADLTSYTQSEQFAKQMEYHAQMASEYQRQRDDEEATDKLLWIAALTGFSVGR